MIDQIEIQNFRCFRRLDIPFCRRINILVGDNGSGKTAILEAIYLALANSPAAAVSVRQFRGFDGVFTGNAKQLEDALWGDLFHNFDLDNPVFVRLGGSGPEARQVSISRTPSPDMLLFAASLPSPNTAASVTFTWTDSAGKEHSIRPRITQAGVGIDPSEETIPDFFMFSSNHPPGSSETAGRLSELSKARRLKEFVEIIKKEYEWIEDLSIEVRAGSPTIYASLKGTEALVPLASISGAINRVIAIYLAAAVRKDGVVIVDELENGVFYEHHSAVWRSLLHISRTQNTQLFISSHSMECLKALREATGENVADIAFWRLERKEGVPVLMQFSGDDLMAALQSDTEIR